MTTPQDPNATVAFDVVSANEPITNELQQSEEKSTTGSGAPTDELDNNEQTPKRPAIDKEKLKVGGLGAAIGATGTAAAMTYGSDMLKSVEEAGTNALHSVENFLGIHHEEPVAPPTPTPPPPVPHHENGPGPDHKPENYHPHQPEHPTPPQPEHPTPQPEPGPDNHLVDLDHDGQPDAVIVDDNGTPELIIDMNHDGQVDGVAIDSDHNGSFDQVYIDSDHDGYADQQLIDLNNDGTPDAVVVDTDGDHGLDTVYADTNQDGQITAEDDHQATGQDQVIAFTDHAGGEEHPTPVENGHDEDIAQNDVQDDYNSHGDVHQWA